MKVSYEECLSAVQFVKKIRVYNINVKKAFQIKFLIENLTKVLREFEIETVRLIRVLKLENLPFENWTDINKVEYKTLLNEFLTKELEISIDKIDLVNEDLKISAEDIEMADAFFIFN